MHACWIMQDSLHEQTGKCSKEVKEIDKIISDRSFLLGKNYQ